MNEIKEASCCFLYKATRIEGSGFLSAPPPPHHPKIVKDFSSLFAVFRTKIWLFSL